MQTQLAPEFQGTPDGLAAEAIVRSCVHCGFCNATCPTYQLLGNELDGPRGRIYLVKQMLEGQPPSRATQLHLDRCLGCRSCETTCPSGVQYGNLLDLGRKLVDARVPRSPGQRAVRWALGAGLPSPLFGPALKLGQAVRGLLPAALQAKVPPSPAPVAGGWPVRKHSRKVLLLTGCVQPALAPNINPASARVLDAIGIECLVPKPAGCCGALKFHLNDQDGGRAHMRANIDAWWPYLEATGSADNANPGPAVEAIVSNASGCGATIKAYAELLQDDPAYAAKAARISALTRDISEWLPELASALQGRITPAPGLLAYHPPCTLQHGQKLRGGVETHLRALGFQVQLPSTEAHFCCGSAGTYSLLQPALAASLRSRKLGHLQALQAQTIVSANIGCISHLQSATATPVRHWVEVLDAALPRSGAPG